MANDKCLLTKNNTLGNSMGWQWLFRKTIVSQMPVFLMSCRLRGRYYVFVGLDEDLVIYIVLFIGIELQKLYVNDRNKYV